MSTLSEIEAAAAALPPDQQKKLLDRLLQLTRLRVVQGSKTHSVLDIPTVSLGGMLPRASDDDDLLGEMLEGRL